MRPLASLNTKQSISKKLSISNTIEKRRSYQRKKSVEDKENGFEQYNQFELTCEGHPICLSDYTTWIAAEKNTHVIHIDDNFTNIETEEDFCGAINLEIPKIVQGENGSHFQP